MRFEGYVVTQALSCVSLTAGSLGLFLHSVRNESAVGDISRIHRTGFISSIYHWFFSHLAVPTCADSFDSLPSGGSSFDTGGLVRVL